MSSPKYASPLSIDIVPSRFLLLAMLLAHAGALAVTSILSLSVGVKLLLVLLVVVSFAVFALRSGWIQRIPFLPLPVIHCKTALWDEHDQWRLFDRDGGEHLAELLPSSYVHPLLVIVNLRLHDQSWHNRKLTLLFLPDNIDREIFRRLRVRLRWYSTQSQDNSLALK